MTTAPAELPLVARTVPVEDPGPLLRLLPPRAGLAWVRRGEGMVAWGEALRISTTGPDRFDAARRAWSRVVAHSVVRDQVGLPGCGPVAFGSFAFSPHSPAGGALVVPEVVVGHRAGTWWVTTIGAGAVLGPIPALDPSPVPASPGSVSYRDGARTGADWEDVVADAIKRIGAGDVAKVVLARDVVASASAPVDPRHLLKIFLSILH